MSRFISHLLELETTLDVSGGANDEAISNAVGSAGVRSGISNRSVAVLQASVSGGTGVDIHLEGRLNDSFAWDDWITPITLADGETELTGIDLGALPEVRVRAVNQDGATQSTVNVVVTSSG